VSDAPEPLAAVDALRQLLEARHSVRAFRPEPVPGATLDAIFAAAQRAPSWCNIQPWRVAVTVPPRTQQVSAALVAAARSGLPRAEVAFPMQYPDPYQDHRRACGHALYAAMGIARDDKARRYDAWLRNYEVFDAPHLAVVACDRRLGPYAYVDVGVWLGYLLAAAEAAGVATCPMASIAAYPDVLRAELPIAATDVVLFGIALGTEDRDAAANRCRTVRDPHDRNVTVVA
jgi:nitroreductase